MTDGSFTPDLALAYLRELSLDVRAAAVLNASGEQLAGAAELTQRARAVLAEADRATAGTQIVLSAEMTLLVAWGENGVAIAVSAGPLALIPLLLHDMTAIAAALV